MCVNCDNKYNFTYIRYATSINGDNISRVRNEGGLNRCYQAVINSNIELDEYSQTFLNLFDGLWVNICEQETCCCKKFIYNVPNQYKNTWKFDGVSTVYESNTNKNNLIKISHKRDGDIVEIPNFKDNFGLPIQDNLNYFFEFYYDTGNLLDDAYLRLQFGDGQGSTHVLIKDKKINGYWSGLIRTSGGVFPSSSLIISIHSKTGDSNMQQDGEIYFSNFRLGTQTCYKRDLSISPIKFNFMWGAGSDSKTNRVASLTHDNIQYDLLGIKIIGWDLIKDLNPVLLIDRYRPKEFKLRRESDNVKVYRKAGYRHEKPEHATLNNRFNEIDLNNEEQWLDFNQDNYFKSFNQPKGNPKFSNSHSPIFNKRILHGVVYLGFRLRFTENGVMRETGHLGFLKMQVIRTWIQPREYLITYNYK